MTEEEEAKLIHMAEGVVRGTLHGEVPMSTVADLAMGVLGLARCLRETREKKDALFRAAQKYSASLAKMEQMVGFQEYCKKRTK